MRGWDPTFWSGKRVFLTGHTGFKGGWLSIWLASMGARVTGYALAPDGRPNLFDLASVGSLLEQSCIADIRHLNTLNRALWAAEPEVVIHMAAQPLVRESYVDPVGTYSTNVMGVVHLLNAIRAAPSVRVVVVVTTDKCYENQEWVWGYRESDAMGGFDPYSSSKGCAELVTAAYRRSFFSAKLDAERGVAVASARAGNVIGGGDWSTDRLLPDIFRALEAGEVPKIRNPSAIRPWQHVLEPLRGYLVLAQTLYAEGPRLSGAYNFGPRPDDAWSVGQVVDAVCAEWGGGTNWRRDEESHLHEANSLKLDISKANEVLGWRPAIGIERAIKMTVDWTKRAKLATDIQPIIRAQIDDYTNFLAQEHD